MSEKSSKKPIEYVILFVVLNIILIPASWYFANFVFATWQKVPSQFIGFTTLIQYNAAYGEFPNIAKAIKISCLAGFLAWIVMNVIVAVALFMKPKRELHGSARFANDAEIRQTGLILPPKEQEKRFTQKPSNPSILIGKHKEKFLEFFGNEFMFVAAPTRSGKGVAIVIPNLLHYRDSVVVLDVKNENWDLTAGFRSKYQECYLFAPKSEDGRSHRYNPLDYIDRDETKRMADIQNIANIFYPSDDPKDAFWQNQAQRIFTGLVLYMMETIERPCTMSELIKLATPTAMPLHEWIPDIVKKRQEQGRELTVECIEALMAYVNVDSDNTRSSILATLLSPLNVFSDPAVAAATSTSDFRLDEVRKKKMSIYVGIQPNELDRFSKLLNVFFSQLINLNTRVLPEQDPSLKYQCLVLLDEFTALGRVGIIQKAVAYIAGYNMRLLLIFQSKSQVEDAYGKEGAKSIFANMACQVIYAPSEQAEAEEYSRMLGTETVKGKSISRNRGKGGGGSVSTSDQRRELMLPQELKELGSDKQIIIYNKAKPILCNKAFYYANPQAFGSRLASLGKPAKGLPIKESCIPPVLDIKGMLRVMRGQEFNEVKSEKDLKPLEYYQKHHAAYLNQLSSVFGFDVDELDEINELEKAVLEPLDEDNNDVEVFNLADMNEYDSEFVDEFGF
ncbi:type IV secretory system conjugative DNA transfer family protein [Moraxella catarrhalis]|mgnify:CR=1 FL=1|uniref:type IV secretory system conjugative DNA transfer family protein n=1 Tax=Moraxella catarrhalis TaxID=480 RepID=UPI0013D833D5|nr:type IV secretory system conjugative DNA transfer family protein [Moraxella catarrhalis]